MEFKIGVREIKKAVAVFLKWGVFFLKRVLKNGTSKKINVAGIYNGNFFTCCDFGVVFDFYSFFFYA